MTPNYGPYPPSQDRVPDWFLGGDRRRRLLEALAENRKDGWTVKELADEIPCGPATVYEVIRVARSLDLLDAPERGRYRLASDGELVWALRSMLLALQPFRDEAVERPARAGRRA
jgi:hypothetical protein